MGMVAAPIRAKQGATSAPGVEAASLRQPETIQRPLIFQEARAKLEFRTMEYLITCFYDDETKSNEEQKKELFQYINEGYSNVCTLRPAMQDFVFPTEAERVNAYTRLTEDGIENYCLAFKEALISRDCLTGIITTRGCQAKFILQSPRDLVLVQYKDDGPQLAITYEAYEKARIARRVSNVSPPSPEKLVELYGRLQLELHGPYFAYWSRWHGLQFMTTISNESRFMLCDRLEMKLRQYLLDVQMAFGTGVGMEYRGYSYTGPFRSDRNGTLEESMETINSIVDSGMRKQSEDFLRY